MASPIVVYGFQFYIFTPIMSYIWNRKFSIANANVKVTLRRRLRRRRRELYIRFYYFVLLSSRLTCKIMFISKLVSDRAVFMFCFDVWSRNMFWQLSNRKRNKFRGNQNRSFNFRTTNLWKQSAFCSDLAILAVKMTLTWYCCPYRF